MTVALFPGRDRSAPSTGDDVLDDPLDLEQYVQISEMTARLRGNDHPLHICEIALEIARQAEILERLRSADTSNCEKIRHLCRDLLDELISENFHVIG